MDFLPTQALALQIRKNQCRRHDSCQVRLGVAGAAALRRLAQVGTFRALAS